MPAGYGVGGYSTGTGTSAGGIASPEGVDNESIGGGGVSPGEGPSNGGGLFSKLGNVVKGMVLGKGKTYNMAMDPNKVSYTQNFLQGSLPKGYTVSESGNTVYSKTTPSAREFAENQFSGIDPDVAFRGAVAGINPETGTMFSGATKGSALDQFTNSMMTPQRADQNASRAKAYASQSARMKSLGSGKRTGKKGALGFLDLDKDGNIFTSTDPYGTVYGMSNKAIYDPSIQNPAYRGIPATYAAKTGGAFPQKTSEDRMLANEIMSYAMPLSGIARLGNWAKGKLSPEVAETQDIRANTGVMTNDEITALANSAINKAEPTFNYNTKPVTTIKLDDLETESNFENFTGQDPYGNNMYSNNPIVGYQADGRTPIYADDPNANQVPYMNVYP